MGILVGKPTKEGGKIMFKEPLGKKVKMLHLEIRKFLDFHLDEYHLGNGQFVILIEVCLNRGASQDFLSKKIGLDKTTIAKSVKKIVGNGYIERIEDENDRRSKKLYPTEKGELVFSKIKNLLELEERILSKGISENEMEIFLKVVNNMKSNVIEYMESGGDPQWKK
jgi:DNA-binding MarR family transcriptional regulator